MLQLNSLDKTEKVIYPDGGIELRKYDVNANLIKNIYPEEYKKDGEDGAGLVSEYDSMNRLVKVKASDIKV